MSVKPFNLSILRSLLRGRFLIYSAGVAISVFIAWLQLFPPSGVASIVKRLDGVIYDQRFNLMPMPVRNYDNKIVIVDIDEKSLQAEGQWPWDRRKVAQLLQKLEGYGVLLTGFDITFPEPQRNLVREILRYADGEELDSILTTQLLSMEQALDADTYFAKTLADSTMDVVLALSFNPVQSVQYGVLPASIVRLPESMTSSLLLHDMAGFTSNIEALQLAATGAGHMNQLPDLDGIVRRVPLIVRYKNQLYPTLALEMARLYFFEESFQLLTYDNGTNHTVEGIRVGSNAGQYELKTDRFGQVLVPYVGRSHISGAEFYNYVSATDVLNGVAEPEILENALVLVGTTAPGQFDLRATPLEAVSPGVEVHANILNGLLQSFVIQELEGGGQLAESGAFPGFSAETAVYFPYKPAWEVGTLFLLLLAVGLILSFVLPRLGPVVLGLTSLGLLALAVWLNFILWSVYKLDISMVLLLLLIALLAVLNMANGFFAERTSRQAIKGMFDQYVPPAHIDAMLKNPENYSFAGESREMSVMFADIRNFTTVSEALTATELKTLLNDFFTPVTKTIFDHNGTIDKYVGDLVMAFWGAPLIDNAHRLNAVTAALQVLDKVEQLRVEFLRRGFPEIRIGVGVNTGNMNVGDMGSVYRRSYTVLGDAVNLASRLEGLTKYYGVSCLIGENTISELNGFVCRLIDKVKVKGKELPVRIYEPVCTEAAASPELLARVNAWNELLEMYFQQQWDAVEKRLKSTQELDFDVILCGIYLQRVDKLRNAQLPENWDGAFQHESK